MTCGKKKGDVRQRTRLEAVDESRSGRTRLISKGAKREVRSLRNEENLSFRGSLELP